MSSRSAIILLVDDEQSILSMLTDVLTDEGFLVEHAQNGREALERVYAKPPDLVVTDLMMPIMDGRALAQHVREYAPTADTPILLISAAYQKQSDDLFTAVMSKPFDIMELIHIVHELLL